MKKPWLVIVLGAIVLLAVGAALVLVQGGGSNEASGGSQEGLIRKSDAGNVEVAAVFMNPNPAEKLSGGELVWKISLNTHSVSLSDMDLAKRAVLTVDSGAAVTQGFTWQSGSGGQDHHVSGLLILKNRDAQGKPLVTKATKSITLELKDVAGVPSRTFRWDNQGWKF